MDYKELTDELFIDSIELRSLEGDTEKMTFDRSIACGELDSEGMITKKGCGRRNWRVIREHMYPPWFRKLICQECGYICYVALPGWR